MGKNVKEFLIDTAKGVTLGVSAAIAGLSAGTIAVVEKCYDKIINAVTSLRKDFKHNFFVLLPFVLGVIIGGAAALIGIQRGYKAAPFTFTGLFAGLIIGSLPVVFDELHKGNTAIEKVKHIVGFLVCLLIAGGLGVTTALANVSFNDAVMNREIWTYFLVFVAGFAAAGACIVPGISGSMVMMVLGLYYPILNTFTGSESILHTGDAMFKITGLIYALILIVGAVVGVVVSSKFMKFMLSKHRNSTFFAIFGLIIGSLVSMFINSDIYPKYKTGIALWDYIVGGSLLVVGAVAIFLFMKFLNKKKDVKEDNQEVSEPEAID